MLESIRGEKEVQENLIFAYDSVETENKSSLLWLENKKYVPSIKGKLELVCESTATE